MRRLLSHLGGFLLLAAPLLGAVGAGEIPDILNASDPARLGPDWVIAERVLTASGSVDPDLFSPGERSLIEGYFARPPKGECIHLDQLIELERIGPDTRPDLASAVRHSDWVFTARVAARAGGFAGSTPGTLLKIVPDEVLKGPRERLWEHYLFMPAGVVEVGRFKLCVSHRQFADLPEVGDEVLLFLDLWQNKSDLLAADGETSIITIHQNESISLPERYRSQEKGLASGRSRADLLRLIRQALRKEG